LKLAESTRSWPTLLKPNSELTESTRSYFALLINVAVVMLAAVFVIVAAVAAAAAAVAAVVTVAVGGNVVIVGGWRSFSQLPHCSCKTSSLLLSALPPPLTAQVL
jgi:hypothetical protein